MPDIDRLRTRFTEVFGDAPEVVVRAPGRVNLIGEHTDYAGLPVLPIAIDRATLVAAASTGGGFVLARSSALGETVELDRGGPAPHAGWGRYLAGVLRELREASPGSGAYVLIESDLPMSSGLSSSSALTVGVMAALAQIWDSPLERADLASHAAAAERYVGVETGGMDQQAIALATAGHALRIDFLPPATRQVPLPQDLALVVASSGEDAPKGGAAKDAYNERVIGARIAALMLADMLGIEIEGTPQLGALADVDAAPLMVEELPEQMAPRSAANAVEGNVDRIIQLTAAHFDASRKVTVRRYARHILSEAERVDAAEAALLTADLSAFGKLLNASHDSLRNDLRCSTPGLDKVAAAMRKAGAFGARLTGAGFGGYALAACPPDMVGAVMEAATAATGGPAFEVKASDRLEILWRR